MAFLWILLGLSAGLSLQWLPLGSHSSSVLTHDKLAHLLNQYVLRFALPALTLAMVSTLPLGFHILLPAGVAWIGFLCCWLYLKLIPASLNRETLGCLLLTAGLGNTSFVGFPMIRSLYGEESLWIALLVDQPGSFLVLSTLGLMAGALYAGKKPRLKDTLKRIIGFPPFLCFGIAIGCNIFNIEYPTLAQSLLKAVGSTLTPAALLAVGLQLKLSSFKSLRLPLIWGLGFRLILAPLIILLIYKWGFKLNGQMLGVSVLEAGMAPMITGSIVASGLGLNPKLASLMVSIGILCSMITVPLWFFLLQI